MFLKVPKELLLCFPEVGPGEGCLVKVDLLCVYCFPWHVLPCRVNM